MDAQAALIKDLTKRLKDCDEDKVNAMKAKIESKLTQLVMQNDEFKLKNAQLQVEVDEQKVQLSKMNDQLNGKAAKESKALVAGNQNAKAQHLMQLKTQMNKEQQEKVVLQEKLKKYEKAE